MQNNTRQHKHTADGCNADSTQCHRGCKDTQGAAAGCAGSGREWEETAGGQDAQIQYNAMYKYKIHTNTNTQKFSNAKLKWRSFIHMYIVELCILDVSAFQHRGLGNAWAERTPERPNKETSNAELGHRHMRRRQAGMHENALSDPALHCI